MDHKTKLDNHAPAFPLGASFFDHLSLWDERNGVLAIHRSATGKLREITRRSPRSRNSSTTSSRPAMPFGEPSYDEWVAAMLDPINRTGGTDPLSRNFHWGINLFGLTGRGLDAGLSLSYDSLVFTKDLNGEFIAFDLNKGFPSPGFQLGFPVIYGPYTSVAEGVDAYLMVTPNGGRVELRQIDETNVYEAADSSYLQMINNGDGSLLVRGTDGARWNYTGTANGYRVTEIKDTNGNYISVTNYTTGRLRTITDTLGRVFTVNYDTYDHPTSISQTRNGSQYTWVTFGYTNVTVDLDFGSLGIVGISDNDTIPLLATVGLPDGTHYEFEYNDYAQVIKVAYFAADSEGEDPPLNYLSNDLASANSTTQTDVPRLGAINVWAKNWNGIEGVPSLVTTTFSAPTVEDCLGVTDFCQMTVVTEPDATEQRTYTIAPGIWAYGLPVLDETWGLNDSSTLVKQRWVTTNWTQDSTSVGYLINPRVTETSIFDSSNQKRTAIGYQNLAVACGSGCSTDIHLPESVAEYAANATTVLRTTETDYLESSNYLSRRIIGLPVETRVYDGTNSGTLMAKTGLYFDETGDYLVSQGSSIPQFDATNYGTSFTYRGNLTRAKRYDVTSSAYTENKIGYNTTGSVILTRDALNHQNSISYVDGFSNATGTNTSAYPTAFTDADHSSPTSSVTYSIYTGQKTSTTGPVAAGQSAGARMDYTYDSIDRLYSATNNNYGANTTYFYATNSTNVTTYSTIKDITNLTVAATNTDGLGRVIATATELPGSGGGYKAQTTVYDKMGRVYETSNPTEINGSFVADGDDVAGFYFTKQTYDWKGRPRIITNQDSATTKEISYSGCGCAGGEVVTVRDEGTMISSTLTRRKQMSYKDVLGRVTKVENYNWDGTTVYQTTTTTYNVLDQPTLIRQYAGDDSSSTYQNTILLYDGFARLHQQHRPEQFATDGITLAPSNTYTTIEYNADDTRSSVTDGRGASTAFTYNNRHLVTDVDYAVPYGSGISVPSDVDYTYDAAGNRTSMTDGLGTVDYAYDELSRLTDETRDFTDTLSSEPGGHYNLHYVYGFSGLDSVRDSFNATVSYAHDKIGQTTAVTGSGTAKTDNYGSNAVFRAWGALKSANLGSEHSVDISYNSRLQPTEFEVPGIIHNEYDYGADGRLTFSHDLMETDSRFDRSFTYDHVGRIEHLRSGEEARDSGATNNNRIYRQDLEYDAMNHLKRRLGKYWSHNINPLSTTDTFVNNRNSFWLWNYDDDGRLLQSPQVQYEYDAAGRIVATTSDRSEITLYYDGDGRRVKSVNAMTNTATPPVTTTVTTYYLPSSVLGQTITELGDTGQKKQGYILNSGGILAIDSPVSTNDKVKWRLVDATGYQQRMTNFVGDIEPDFSAELDPFGTNAELSGPVTRPPRIPGEDLGGSINGLGFGDPFAHGSTECRNLGIEVPCGQALALLNSDAGLLGLYAGLFTDIPGLGTFFNRYDRSVPTWQFQGEENDFSAYHGIAWASDSFVSIGGEEPGGPEGPEHPLPEPKETAENSAKPKCDAKPPTEDDDQMAAIYKMSTEHTPLSFIGLKEWNVAGTVRNGNEITWGTLMAEALLIGGTIAFTAESLHASWQATVLSVFGSGGGHLTPDVAFDAGRKEVDKALNSDIDSAECEHLKIAIEAARRIANGSANQWKNAGFTQWRGRWKGGGYSRDVPKGANVLQMGDSYFFYVFPGNRLK